MERDKGISDSEVDEPKDPQKSRQAERPAEDPDATTSEEPELPGLRRPKYGEGWWARGPTLRPHKKGLVKEFIDGAGYPSPGRWRVQQRRLPDEDRHRRLRSIFVNGVRTAEKSMPGGDMKKAFLSLAAGEVRDNPFPEKLVHDTRLDLMIELKNQGHDAVPRVGDAVQVVEVRLLQALLEAYGDPVAHFGNFWARGVWLGSKKRRFPRTPALYARKTKWPLNDPDL